MSEIKVDTLTGKTTANDITVTVGASATMSLEQGLIKHWSHYDQATTPSSNQDSFNASSVTDNATGDYQQNFANNMSNGNFSAGTVSNFPLMDLAGSPSTATTYIRVGTRNNSFADTDADDNLMMVAGDLA